MNLNLPLIDTLNMRTSHTPNPLLHPRKRYHHTRWQHPTTTNPIVFDIDGKKQSCIGDDVCCPACQSMGQIIPTGPRLSFSLGGAMPALNDDLCLCKCNPPPKLVHSQTSFKEDY